MHLPQLIIVIYVAGLDLFNRCNGIQRLRSPHRAHVAVVYWSGENEALVQRAQTEHTCGQRFIGIGIERHMLKDGQSSKHLTYPLVLKYLEMTSLQQTEPFALFSNCIFHQSYWSSYSRQKPKIGICQCLSSRSRGQWWRTAFCITHLCVASYMQSMCHVRQ